MKKIGIATFHFADNYGAVLQTYALYNLIKKMEDCNVEIINYIPNGYQYSKCWNTIYQRKEFDKKREMFERFLIQYCDLNINKKVNCIEDNEYDICCVGSDQIWNTSFDISNEYFLPHLKSGVRKISYAASIGVSVSSPAFNKEWFKRYISDFDFISIREYEHVDVVSQLSHKVCNCVLDPTLLLSEDDYEKLLPKKENTTPYVLFYWLSHDRNLMRGVELTNTIARKYNLKVIHSVYDVSNNMFVNQGECMIYDSIEDFLWLVKNADFVVTNSYHGTIFSMIFRKPFYTFIVESMKSRIDTLATNIDISKHIVCEYISFEDINKKIIDLNMEKKYIEKKQESILFLKEAIR